MAVSEAVHQRDGPLGRTPGAVEVASRHAHMGGDREHPAHDVAVGGDLGRLERLVLEGCRRRQVAPPHRAQRLRAEVQREELLLTGGARHGDAARGVTDRVVVALDQELRQRQAVDGVEVPGERLVGDRVQMHRGLVDARPGLDDGSGVRAGVGQRGGGGADEHGILERPGRGERPPAEAARPVDVEREEGHRHQREQGGHGLWRALVRERFEGGREASLRLLVAAEEVLGGRAAGGEGHPQPGLAGRNQVDRLEQRGDAAVEVAGRAQHLREADQRSQASRLVGLRQEPQGGAEPASGGGGCARRGRGTGLEQQLDRRGVALHRRLLDVMGPRSGRRPAGREAARRAGVRDEPPAAAGGLVDRAAHERVAEREAAGHGGRVQKARVEQLVERGHPLIRRQLRDLAGELGLERVARDRARVQEPARGSGQRVQLLHQRGRHRARDAGLHRHAVPRRAARRRAARRERAAARRTGCRRSR